MWPCDGELSTITLTSSEVACPKSTDSFPASAMIDLDRSNGNDVFNPRLDAPSAIRSTANQRSFCERCPMQAFMRAMVLVVVVTTGVELWAQSPQQNASSGAEFTTPVLPPAASSAVPAPAPGPTLVQQPPYGAQSPSRRPGQRDPTQPSRTLREAIDATNVPAATSNNGQPAPLPRFSIKARIVAHNSTPVALIQIDEDKIMAIKPGFEYAVPAGSGSGYTHYRIKVKSITAAGIEMDLLPVNMQLVLQ